MNNQQQRVIAAVIEDNGRFLVCRRAAHKRHGGLWEFPGGKLELGETLAQAAQRELAEELSLRVTNVGSVRLSVVDSASGFLIEFVNVGVEGELQLHEHSAAAWVTALELMELPLAPSDRSFAESLPR